MPIVIKSFFQRFKEFFTRANNKIMIGAVIFFVLTLLIMTQGTKSGYLVISVDEVAPHNIQANSTTVIIDEAQTEELKRQAAFRVQKVYQQDLEAMGDALHFVDAFFQELVDILQSPEENKREPLQVLLASLTKEPVSPPRNDRDTLASYWSYRTPEEAEQVRITIAGIVQDVMKNPVAEEALTSVNEQAAQLINISGFVQAERDTMQYVLVNATRPNLVFNQDATTKAIKEAEDAVQPVTKTIKAGEIIVREGDRVTAEQINVLEQLGFLRSNTFPFAFLGIALFILLTMWLVYKFLGRYYKKNHPNERAILLLELVFLFILIISYFIFMIQISDQPPINTLVGFLAPVAAGSMLIAILLDWRLAFFWTMLTVLFIGLLNTGNQLYYVMVAFVGGTIGIYRVNRINQTSDLAVSGLYIALANIITITIIHLISGQVDWVVLTIGAIIGAINGVLSSVLMIGTLPFLESAFNITSMIKLLELSNPNHAILRRLLMEAPGTYHHSLMVGNLAEATADSIGANPMLVRAGAYYHDIGKLKRPDYFVENQNNFGNPHERIAPALSALIVTSHVRDGVEIAKEAKLPQSIIDFIEQHHGTSLTRYFYNTALQEQNTDTLSEEGFRYEGPKPQNKETALVMLADAVEAGVRSLTEATPTAIKKMVNAIIQDKLQDGQLGSSDLTFKDLDIIADSFCRILEGIYHKRITYPDVVAKEFAQRREQHGNLDHQ